MNGGVYFGQLVIGPAGSGKSTYCKIMQEMAQTLRRHIVVINLDPAAEDIQYRCDADIQQLISLEDVMEEMELGPNGGLLFCIQYLLQNQSWLHSKLAQCVANDDYVIFDCPGQIQLYTDQNVFRELVKVLQTYGFSLVSLFVIDASFLTDEAKYMSALLQALSAQIALELPSITVLSKCDLLGGCETADKILQKYNENDQQLEYFSQQNVSLQKKNQNMSKNDSANIKQMKENFLEKNINNQLIHKGKSAMGSLNSSAKLFSAIRTSLRDNDATSIRTLNIEDEDSIRDLLQCADTSIQYGENLQSNDKFYDEAQKAMNSQTIIQSKEE